MIGLLVSLLSTPLTCPEAVPEWVRKFTTLEEFEQARQFDEMKLSAKVQLAIEIQELQEPPDIHWESKIIKMGAAVVPDLQDLLRKERCDRMIVGLIVILAGIRLTFPSARLDLPLVCGCTHFGQRGTWRFKIQTRLAPRRSLSIEDSSDV